MNEHEILICLSFTREVKETINILVFCTITTSVGGVLFSSIQIVTVSKLTMIHEKGKSNLK